MAKSASKTLAYALIEAGQIAHRELAAPLRLFGLEAGDDALILALGEGLAKDRAALCGLTGLDDAQIGTMLARLADIRLIELGSDGSSPQSLRLSEEGLLVYRAIEAHWLLVETNLAQSLGALKKGKIRKALNRFVRSMAS